MESLLSGISYPISRVGKARFKRHRRLQRRGAFEVAGLGAEAFLDRRRASMAADDYRRANDDEAIGYYRANTLRAPSLRFEDTLIPFQRFGGNGGVSVLGGLAIDPQQRGLVLCTWKSEKCSQDFQ